MGKGRILSFKNAIEGLWIAAKEEPNLKIHLTIGIFIYILGFLVKITITEWLIITLTIGLVIGLELTNTAIEEVVNSFTQDIHPAAKKAKDVAAGAVLIASITAVLIGFAIFMPYLLPIFLR